MIRCLASEIFDAAGELRGGEINFIAGPPIVKGRSYRWLEFWVDDNVDDSVPYGEDYTALRVITRQSTHQLRDIIRWGGAIALMVERIESNLTADLERDPEPLFRVVHGRLKLIARGDADRRVDLQRLANEDYIRYEPKPLQARMTPTFNAAQQLVHVHALCLDDAGVWVSRAEKHRRMELHRAAFRDGLLPDAMRLDGNRRLRSLN